MRSHAGPWPLVAVGSHNVADFRARPGRTHRRLRAPGRHYHDLRHVEALLGLARANADAIADRDVVEAAIWFHDVVYDTRRHDNEERGAALAVLLLAGTAGAQRIACIAMIQATAGHDMPNLGDAAAMHDCALFLDMDLAILGSAPEEFNAYEKAVRREYDWVAEPEWIAARRRVLEHFLARPAIYASARFRATREAAARRNLAGALARLGSPRSSDSAGSVINRSGD